MALGVSASILAILSSVFNNFYYSQLGPWLAVEIPDLIKRGVVVYKEQLK